MKFSRMTVLLLFLLLSVYSYCHQYYPQQNELKVNRNHEIEDSINLKMAKVDKNLSIANTFPNSRRLEKMLEKAILKIITGDLSNADMQLLKSLNYSLEEILDIRERETSMKKEEELRKMNQVVFFHDLPHNTKTSQDRSSALNNMTSVVQESSSKKVHIYESREKEFEEYNRQAVYDYENMVASLELQESEFEKSFENKPTQDDVDQSITPETLYQNINKIMEPQVIFKIRYDNSEFDSTSNEKSKSLFKTRLSEAFQNKDYLRIKNSRNNLIVSKSSCKSFHGHNFSLGDLCSLAHRVNVLKIDNTSSWSNVNSTHVSIKETLDNGLKNMPIREMMTILFNNNLESQTQNITTNIEYDSLDWREDDMYKIIEETTDLGNIDNKYYNYTNDHDIRNIFRQNQQSYSGVNDRSEIRNDGLNDFSETINAN